MEAGEHDVVFEAGRFIVAGTDKAITFGTVGALPAVMNAVNDALARVGGSYVQMPAIPEKVRRALQGTHSQGAIAKPCAP
jgi:hypothetical protein